MLVCKTFNAAQFAIDCDSAAALTSACSEPSKRAFASGRREVFLVIVNCICHRVFASLTARLRPNCQGDLRLLSIKAAFIITQDKKS